MHPHIDPAPCIMVWSGIGYHSRTNLVRTAGTLNSQRYFSEVLEPVVLPYIQGFVTAILQQDKARIYVARIVERFFVNHQIELLPWSTFSPDLSPLVVFLGVAFKGASSVINDQNLNFLILMNTL
ncbi:transposable element Tcb1 transposase [Trichonephila clavipes]|nr:transposable element Tcb1 transposase [Trichonephila clavipes]